jgi:hypothetical protein
MRKTALALIFISALLFSAVNLTYLGNLVTADPYLYLGDLPPDPYTKPPDLLVSSPINNTVYTSNNILFSFDVSKPVSPRASQTILTYIYYEADWQQNTSFVYDYGVQSSYYITEFHYSQELSGIPEGKHSIVIHADGKGWYPPSGISYYGFEINGSSPITFTIETTPVVSLVPFANRTFTASAVPLNFTVNQMVSKITYSVDGQENVTINGNTTLTGLPNGDHNVIVYATDEAGKTGASEAIEFTVAVPDTVAVPEPEPFAAALAIAVSVVIVAVVAVGFLVHWKKRKQ